ncbi:hypothetical protein PSHT_02960 [Puccinia striiformis]|uniref:Uncharacterized protein n=1 Tax=Puccinia striiformis TaxID=27350 RepID=A0A2S4WGG7_9BASI|nr:hypothetical protein PSHT_02960 [Puccinia striiformis]
MSFVEKSLPLLITEPEPTSDIPNTHEPKVKLPNVSKRARKVVAMLKLLPGVHHGLKNSIGSMGDLSGWISSDRREGSSERDTKKSTGPDEILSGSGGQLLYPIEEQALPSSDKPSEAEFIDTRLKAALLKSFLNTHDCTRRDPFPLQSRRTDRIQY